MLVILLMTWNLVGPTPNIVDAINFLQDDPTDTRSLFGLKVKDFKR